MSLSLAVGSRPGMPPKRLLARRTLAQFGAARAASTFARRAGPRTGFSDRTSRFFKEQAMVTDVRKGFRRLAVTAGGTVVAVALTAVAWGQQNTGPATSGQEARDKAKEKIDAAKDSKQGARE